MGWGCCWGGVLKVFEGCVLLRVVYYDGCFLGCFCCCFLGDLGLINEVCVVCIGCCGGFCCVDVVVVWWGFFLWNKVCLVE